MAVADTFAQLLRVEVDKACQGLLRRNDDAATLISGQYVTRLRSRLNALVRYARANGIPVGDVLDRYKIGELDSS